MVCEKCNGTGVLTDENGVQYDDVCPTCQGIKANRFEAFTEHEQSVIAVAFFLATEQWHKDGKTIPELKQAFDNQIETAGKLLDELR